MHAAVYPLFLAACPAIECCSPSAVSDFFLVFFGSLPVVFPFPLYLAQVFFFSLLLFFSFILMFFFVGHEGMASL